MGKNIKVITAAVIGVLGTFWGLYGAIITFVALAIALDLITELIKAIYTCEKILNNKVTKVLLKKTATLLGLALGFFLDFWLPMLIETGSNLRININLPFGLIMGPYIIINEVIHTIENLYACDVAIPSFIIKIMKLSKEALNAGPEKERF